MEYDGHKVRLTNGYYDVYYPEHPRARNSGSVMLQILVAEKILRRYLKDDEVVHHIDSDRLNNDPSNLMVFATHADHARYHQMMTHLTQNYVVYRADGVYHCMQMNDFLGKYTPKYRQNSGVRSMKLCPQCGKLMSYTAKLCRSCYNLSSRKVMHPNRTILKSDIRKMPMLQVAKQNCQSKRNTLSKTPKSA